MLYQPLDTSTLECILAVSWMPVSAMISSKRLGVQERSGCCTVNTEAPVEGPYEPWAGSAKAGAGPWVGTQWLVVEVRVVAYGARCAPCPPSPFQLPSTSRRRGFKDPWGGCRLSALGSGRSGLWEVGGASCLPRAQPSPEGPGLCGMSGSLPPWLLGGGYPTVIMWAVTVCGACQNTACLGTYIEDYGPKVLLRKCIGHVLLRRGNVSRVAGTEL